MFYTEMKFAFSLLKLYIDLSRSKQSSYKYNGS